MNQKERVHVLRAAGYKGYDKYLDSKVMRPAKYGVTWTDSAKTALDAVATAQESEKAEAIQKRPVDRHKHKGRLTARMPQDQILRVQDAVKACGYGTVQSWIGICAYRLLYEADKRRKAGASHAEKSPSGTAIQKGARKNTPSTEYHESEAFVKCP